MHRAVFLDRDGTIIEEVGYLSHISQVRLYPWSAAAIRRLNQAGLKVVMTTNQSGIGRGFFPPALVEETHEKLRNDLALSGAFLDGIYYCPHHPEAAIEAYRVRCDCRKPEPGLLLRAAQDLNLDLAGSYVVGDKYTDVQLAFSVGARAVLVLTGYGRGEWEEKRAAGDRAPDFLAETLADASEWIVQQSRL
jgi:D-glycero-D-manno-heptose 1,7-bisphosphate phosphatase